MSKRCKACRKTADLEYPENWPCCGDKECHVKIQQMVYDDIASDCGDVKRLLAKFPVEYFLFFAPAVFVILMIPAIILIAIFGV